MVACKTVGEYKRNQEKIRKFCLEEKAEQARQQEARVKQARSTPLKTAQYHSHHYAATGTRGSCGCGKDKPTCSEKTTHNA